MFSTRSSDTADPQAQNTCEQSYMDKRMLKEYIPVQCFSMWDVYVLKFSSFISAKFKMKNNCDNRKKAYHDDMLSYR